MSDLAELERALGLVARRLGGSDARGGLRPSFVLGELGLEAPPPPHPGPSLGRYQILRELGAGGMGRVYECHDPELGRTVAVKRLHPGQASAEVVARFLAEARITAQLDHPNIVPVHEVGVTDEGALYFVMKRVQGAPLAHVLEAIGAEVAGLEGEWSLHRLLVRFVAACHAVAYAHAHGVLHRDLTPTNILLGALGQVQVMDWGLAWPLGEAAQVRWAGGLAARDAWFEGQSVGTPGYMSPEQILGNPGELTPTSDVFSLGCVLYEILTLRPAFPAQSPLGRLAQTTAGPPPGPREVCPERRIAGDLAAICMRALATAPGERWPSAEALAEALERYLEGSARRVEAARWFEAAQQEWQLHLGIAHEAEAARAREAQLTRQIAPWASLAQKAPLVAVRQRRAELAAQRATAFARVVGACEKSLAHDPEHADARALLARLYAARLVEAEAQRAVAESIYCRDRLQSFDDGRYASFLRGTGALTLATDPPGAEAVARRFEPSGLCWLLGEPILLGATPLEGRPLPQGSYLVTLRYPGRRDTLYPVLVSRSRHWMSGADPIPLFTDAEIGAAFVYVPAGPAILGGDASDAGPGGYREAWVDGFLVARDPVTAAGYCEFVNSVHSSDPEEAWSRAPRASGAVDGDAGQAWRRPAPAARYEVPAFTGPADPAGPEYPITGVSWMDALEYALYRSRSGGAACDLPTEEQWEKAARGVDGRGYPWGDAWDPTLCRMRQSQPGDPVPGPVGSFEADRSVYGVRDLAGSASCWCGDPDFDGHGGLRPVRGGSWLSDEIACRSSHRQSAGPWAVDPGRGIRLVRPLPG